VCCFEYLFCAPATIRQLVLGHLTKEAVDALRQVSRDVRAAVNENVVTVSIELNGPRSNTDLAEVFPGASRLRVTIRPWEEYCVAQHVLTKEAAVCTLLERIVLATSPALVTKLQGLTLSLGNIHFVDAIAAAVAGFLSRCDHTRVMDFLDDRITAVMVQHVCCLRSSDHDVPLFTVELPHLQAVAGAHPHTHKRVG
jgi:hypothetical protein